MQLALKSGMENKTQTKVDVTGCPIEILLRLNRQALLPTDAAGLALHGRAELETVAAAIKTRGGPRSAATLVVLRAAWALAK